METNNTSAELLIPFEEDYLIEIRAISDGGEGSSSEEIRIPAVSSEFSPSLEHFCYGLLIVRKEKPEEPGNSLCFACLGKGTSIKIFSGFFKGRESVAC